MVPAGLCAQEGPSATIRGRLLDGETGEPLIGASVSVGSDVVGTATDYDGTFVLRNIKGDSATLNISFIGFNSRSVAVALDAPEVGLGDIELRSDAAQLEEVVVSASLEGQQKALNQQRTADNIKNIVSADLIGRFPDLNVAEALQRVPGVNISRARGEGSTISLRGTPAHFTSININGEQVPSTQDNGARNESLDLIPADQLASMEIVKAITPDMDGDAIGGSVNLRTPTARSRSLQLRAEAGGGYNSLSQSYNGIGRFKIGKRFFGKDKRSAGKLGLLAGFSYFETDNEEDKLEAIWSSFGDIPIISLGRDTVVIENHQISDLKNQRTRLGATLTLDYRFSPKSDIIFNFMFSRRSDLDERNRLRVFLNESAGVQWQSLDTIRQTELRRDVAFRDYFSENLSYNLEGKHGIGQAVVDWGLYYADSRREEDGLNGRFERGSDYRVDLAVANSSDGIYTTFPRFQAINSEFDFYNPFIINEVSRYDLVGLTLESDNAVGKVNFLLPYQWAGASGSFKTGVKYRRQSNARSRANTIYNYSDPNRVIDEREGFASLISDFEDENFLDNNMRFGASINEAKFRDFIDENVNLFVFDRISSDRNTFNDTYKARENIFAAYLMNRLQFSRLMVLAGLRYETNRVDYDAFEVNNITGEARPVSDGTAYDFLLPNVHLRYAVDRLTNLRAAATWSYARANFNDLVPFLNIDEEGSRILAGNPALRPGSAMNIDLMAERYLGTVGILSGGLFYKNIDDFQFSRNLRFLRPGDPFYEEFPGFQFRQEQNGENAQVYGFEFNAQAGLNFLPGALKGIGLYFNYTFTESDAFTSDRDDINLPGQARHTWNAALSYDYRSFSAKASLNYNGAFLRTVAGEARNDLIQEGRLQMDINASFKFMDGFRVFAEFLNVTNSPAIIYQGIEERIAEYAYFGWWNRFGLSYNL